MKPFLWVKWTRESRDWFRPLMNVLCKPSTPVSMKAHSNNTIHSILCYASLTFGLHDIVQYRGEDWDWERL